MFSASDSRRITGVVIYDNRMFESLANEPSVRKVMAALIKPTIAV